MTGERKLAVCVVGQCLEYLKKAPPPMTVPEDKPRFVEGAAWRRLWEKQWEQWATDRTRELRFLSGKDAAVWFELAGLDLDVAISKLRKHDMLYDPPSKFPEGLDIRLRWVVIRESGVPVSEETKDEA